MKRYGIFSLGLVAVLGIAFMLKPQGQRSVQQYVWSYQGPDNFSGMARTVAIAPNGRIYVGFIGGGIWYSDDKGITWQPLSSFNDKVRQQSNVNLMVSDILIDPDNPQKIYVATGDLYFGRLSAGSQQLTLNEPDYNGEVAWQYGYYGRMGQGVFVSLDGGQTFSNNNATWPYNYPQTVYEEDSNAFISVQRLAKVGNMVLAGTIKGLYFTVDDFQTVSLPTYTKSNIKSALERSIVLDIEVGGGKIWIVALDPVAIDAKIALYEAVVENNILKVVEWYKWLDKNTDTLVRGDANAPSFSDRIDLGNSNLQIAISPSDPQVIYMVGANVEGKLSGIWRSRDGGKVWQLIASGNSATFSPLFDPFSSIANLSGGQTIGRGMGRFALAVAVSPTNPNKLYLGGQEWVVYDDATGWQVKWTNLPILPSYPLYVAKNVFDIAFHPSDTNFMVVATATNIFISNNQGETFFQARGIPTASILRVHKAVDNTYWATNPFAGVLKRPSLANKLYAYTGDMIIFPEIGYVKTSVYNPEKGILGTTYQYLIKRTLDGGGVYEEFWDYPDTPSVLVNGAPDSILTVNNNGPGGDKLDGTVTFTNRRIYTLTPFVLSEYKQDSIIVRDTNGNYLYPSRLYTLLPSAKTANGWGVWYTQDPFNLNDTLLTRWTRVSPKIIMGSKEATSAAAQIPNQETVFFGTTKGQLIRVTNANDPLNATTIRIDTLPGNSLPQKAITAIAVHPNNPDLMVIAYGSYDTTGGYLYISTNATSAQPTFTRLYVNNLPVTPIYDVEFSPASVKPAILIATEVGLWLAHVDANPTTAIELNEPPLRRTIVYDIEVSMWRLQKEVLSIDPNGIEKAQYRLLKRVYPTVLLATEGNGVLEIDIWQVSGTTPPQATALQDKILVTLYPNPVVQQTFNLRFQSSIGNLGAITLKILDLQGRILRVYNKEDNAEHQVQVDVSGLPAGVYLLQVDVPKHHFQKTLKFIKAN